MKKRKQRLALLLSLTMTFSVMAVPGEQVMAAPKKAKIYTAKKTYSVAVNKTATITVNSKNIKKIKSIKAVSAKKSVVTVVKIKSSKKSAKITVKAKKQKSAKVRITVKYVGIGSKKIKTKKLTVTVKGTKNKTTKPKTTPKVTATPIPEATATPTPKVTATPTPEATAIPTPQATATPTPEATATPTPEATATPTPEATATPTPEATAIPTPEATATPTPIATATPTPVIANIQSVRVENTSATLIVTLDNYVSLASSDFEVSYVPYGSDTPVSLIPNANYTDTNTYTVSLSKHSDEEDYFIPISYGSVFTVTIDKLTGTTKTKTATWMNPNDGRTENFEHTYAQIESTETYQVPLPDTYGLIGEVTYTRTDTDNPEAALTLNYEESENYYYLTVDTSQIGDYSIPITLEDEMGTTIYYNITIHIIDATTVAFEKSNYTINLSLYEGEESTYYCEYLSYVGPAGNYTATIEAVDSDPNENVQVSDNYGSVYFSGDFYETQTYTITITENENPENTNSCTLTINILNPTTVSGTILDKNGNSFKPDSISIDFYKNGELNYSASLLDTEESLYEAPLFPGTYSAIAIIYCNGTSYFSKIDEVVVGNTPITNLDFAFDIPQPQIINFHFNGEGLDIFDEEGEVLPEYDCYVAAGDWKDANGNILGSGGYISLLPGTYTLYNDSIIYYDNTTEAYVARYCTSVSFTVENGEGASIRCNLAPYTPSVYGSIPTDGTSKSFDTNKVKNQLISFTPTESGLYCLAPSYQSMAACFDTGFIYDEDMNCVSALSLNEKVYVTLTANKTYYLADLKLSIELDNLVAISTFDLSIQKAETVTVSGTLTDENGDALHFSEEQLPTVYSHVSGSKLYGEVSTDGTYHVIYPKDITPGRVTFLFHDSSYSKIYKRALTENTTLDVAFYQINTSVNGSYDIIDYGTWINGEGDDFIFWDGSFYIPVSNADTELTYELYTEAIVIVDGEESCCNASVSFQVTDSSATIEITPQ